MSELRVYYSRGKTLFLNPHNETKTARQLCDNLPTMLREQHRDNSILTRSGMLRVTHAVVHWE